MMSEANNGISRRAAMRTGGALVTALGASVLLAEPANAGVPVRSAAGQAERARRAAKSKVLVGKSSANGWAMEKGVDIGGSIWTRPVEGSPVSIGARIPDAAAVLVYVVRRFNYEIDSVRAGDVVGFRPYRRGMPSHESNHASGTAIDIRPGWYPRGIHNGFFPHQVAVIRDILDKCEGVVAWGGDFQIPHESHFEIAVRSVHSSRELEHSGVDPSTAKSTHPSNSDVSRVAQKIRQWDRSPGEGAGA